MRLLFRFVGLLLLAGAFAALIVDGTRSVASGTVSLMPFGRAFSGAAPGAFTKLHQTIEGHLPILWDPVLVTVFLLPTWLVLGAAGLLLFTITRRVAPKIGYSRR